jgi:hypothetical protein
MAQAEIQEATEWKRVDILPCVIEFLTILWTLKPNSTKNTGVSCPQFLSAKSRQPFINLER